MFQVKVQRLAMATALAVAPWCASCAPSSGGSCADYRTCGRPGPEGGASASEQLDGSLSDAPSVDGSSTDGSTSDKPCDPSLPPSQAPCALSEAFGVFVAPSEEGGSDETGIGTRSSPFATISHAVSYLPQRVFVCTGTAPYNEQITLESAPSGVGLYGGLSCAGGVWSYTGTPTTIASPSSDFALKVDGVSGAVDIEDMAFVSPDASGQDAKGNGRSSLAAVINASSDVTFRRCSLLAGSGSNGQEGATGESNYDGATAANGSPNSGTVGGDGGAGAFGTAGCTFTINSVASITAGGAGGSSGLPMKGQPDPNPGQDGVAVPPSIGTGQGMNGLGGQFGLPGNPGANGYAGSPGAATAAPGTLGPSGWVPSAGGAGGIGYPGQGGGGGGCCFNSSQNGGGGGGAGGCGGSGGPGGGGGGASIALASVGSSVTLDGCTLTTSAGGNGGNGGPGQAGQGGGAPTLVSGVAAGGYGGNGAGGGGGAGGTGGLSACVVYKNGNAPIGLPMCIVGAAGLPGSGGEGGEGGDNVPSQGYAGRAGSNGSSGAAGLSLSAPLLVQ